MILLRSLLFKLFLYTGIVTVFLIALPTLFLPPIFTLLFGKFLGHYVVFIVKIFLNTKVEFKGENNIPNTEKYFVASAHQSMFETFALQAVLDYPVFGHTFPEFNAIGMHGIFNASYILPTPFLKGTLSPIFILVP